MPPDLGGAGAGEARVDVDAARVAGEFERVGAGAARVEARQVVDEGLWVGRRGPVRLATDSCNGQLGGATAREAGLHAIPVRIQGDLASDRREGAPVARVGAELDGGELDLGAALGAEVNGGSD